MTTIILNVLIYILHSRLSLQLARGKLEKRFCMFRLVAREYMKIVKNGQCLPLLLMI